MLPLRSGQGQASHSNGGPEPHYLLTAARLARIAQVAQKRVKAVTLTQSREPSRSYIPDPSIYPHHGQGEYLPIIFPSPQREVTETPEGPAQKHLFIKREITAASVSPVRRHQRENFPTAGGRMPRITREGTRDSESLVQKEERDVRAKKAPRKEGTRTGRVGHSLDPRSQEPKD